MSNINSKSIEVHVIGHEELIIGCQSALSLIEQQDKLGYISTYLRVPTVLLTGMTYATRVRVLGFFSISRSRSVSHPKEHE